MNIPDKPITYKPRGRNRTTKYDGFMQYRCGKDMIDVLLWHRWPSYDFIFGVPAKTNRYYKTEAAFFQYRDTRRRKIKCGFYVDKRELDILVKGFVKLSAHAQRAKKKKGGQMNEEKPPEHLKRLAADVGGKIDWCARLPDGSGAATMSFPLPKDHWLTKEGYNDPPMPFRIGVTDPPILGMDRKAWAEKIREAAKYAVRASTMNGKEDDFDPDAMLQNMVVGMLGYWTTDGREGSPSA